MEEKVVKMEEGQNRNRRERVDQQKRMKVEIQKVRDELQLIENCTKGGSGDHTDEFELKKLLKDMVEMTVEKESGENNLIRNVED